MGGASSTFLYLTSRLLLGPTFSSDQSILSVHETFAPLRAESCNIPSYCWHVCFVYLFCIWNQNRRVLRGLPAQFHAHARLLDRMFPPERARQPQESRHPGGRQPRRFESVRRWRRRRRRQSGRPRRGGKRCRHSNGERRPATRQRQHVRLHQHRFCRPVGSSRTKSSASSSTYSSTCRWIPFRKKKHCHMLAQSQFAQQATPPFLFFCNGIFFSLFFHLYKSCSHFPH